MKKLAIIGTAGIPARYGGFETLVEHLIPHLVKQMIVTVYCSSKIYNKQEQLSYFNGAKLIYLPLSANGIMSVFYDVLSILKAVRKHNVLLVLGVSGAFMFPFIRIFSKKKLLVNIDGIEWKREKWGRWAKLFLKWSEKIAVTYAHEVICDNQVVLDYVEAKYKISARLIAYGGDHVKKQPIQQNLVKQYSQLLKPYAFKVARIEPENNIQMILEAFSKSNHQLIIVGNWQNSTYGKILKKQYSEHANILILEPIYELQILDQFRSNCSYYVHGHSAGGTNPSLVEAMSMGLPIVSYGVNFNKETTNHQAMYFNGQEELENLINSINVKALISNGINMKNIADCRYTWKVISSQYSTLMLNEAKKETYSLINKNL